MPLAGIPGFLKWAVVAALVFAGCAQLKQCAYEGFNRDKWQKPQAVIESLELAPGAIVADLGAGGGYFTFKLARVVGAGGRVFAADVDPDMNELIAAQAKKEGVANVETILAKPDDPLLPATGVDLIFTVNTYHHLENRVDYFSNLRRYLRPGGRIAIIELDGRGWFEGLLRHYTSADLIKREMGQAGYALQREFDFLDRQSFLIFALES